MDVFPALSCVLQHWYEFRPPGEELGPVNNKRFVAAKALHMVARRQGQDALRGEILRAARGERTVSTPHLPVGAGLFPDNLYVETLVRQGLNSQNLEQRIAATYGAIYFLRKSEEVAFILSERVVLAEEHRLVVAASCDALDIWRETKDGGRCRRCGRMGGLPSTLKQPDWALTRAS